MSDIDNIEEIWVTITEAAKLTGYSRDHVQKIAYDNWSLPEEQREIVMRRNSAGYLIYLPSLVEYSLVPGNGPKGKRKQPDT
jgi:hypothetical protein